MLGSLFPMENPSEPQTALPLAAVPTAVIADASLSHSLLVGSFLETTLSWEMRTRVAVSGAELLQIAEETRPELVITDIDFSDVAGPSLVEQIRERSPGSAVIVYTNALNPHRVRDCFALKPNGFVLKSETLDVFATALNEVAMGRDYCSPGWALSWSGLRAVVAA